MRKRILVTLILSVAGTVSEAAPIIYTETAQIFGFVNGVPISGKLLTLTAFGDTASIVWNGTCCFFAPTPNVAFSVADVGSGIFTHAVGVVSNTVNGSTGFSDFSAGRAILFTTNPAAFGANYDLSTSIGPITGTALYNSGFAFPTTVGDLVILSSGNSTFTATIVPLPAALWLLGSALGVLASVRRKTIET
jgi:hypothetical protein